MRRSLRSQLNDLIRARGEVPIEEVYRVTLELGYKASNAERRLRNSESPDVFPVMRVSRRGTQYVAAYRWGAGKPEPKPTVRIEGNRAIITYQKK